MDEELMMLEKSLEENGGVLPSPAAPAPAVASPAPVSEPEVSISSTRVIEYVDVEQAMRDLDVPDAMLDDAFRRHAGLLAFYGARAASAKGQVTRIKLALDGVQAHLDKLYRDDMTKAGVKITETAVEHAIKRDPRYIKAVGMHRDAVTIADLASKMYESFVCQRDMLLARGHDRRSERRVGELRISDNGQQQGAKPAPTAASAVALGLERHANYDR